MTVSDKSTLKQLRINRTTLWAPNPLDIPAVSARFSISGEANPESWSQSYKGIFDSGTLVTMISTRIVNQLNSKSTESEEVNTAFDPGDAPIHHIDVMIHPMQLIITNIKAYEANLDTDVDFLIGADILSLGDLSINTHHGFKVIDFVIYEPFH